MARPVLSTRVLSALKAADDRVEAHCLHRRVDTGGDALPLDRLTLAPERSSATTLVELQRLLGPRLVDGAAGEALAEGMVATADAIITHFPDNLFWDLDGMAAALVERGTAVEIGKAFDEVVGLIALYGRQTAIRFRYMHDFMYGFDWAKWVRRKPGERAGVGPFDEVLLAALFERGHELLALIERDDVKYGRLPDSRARNPFGFSREPDDEIRLYRALVREGIVPIRMWQFDAAPTWDRPFADLRAAHARLAET